MVEFLQCLQAVCSRQPQALALVQGDRQLTYGQLWEALPRRLPPGELLGLEFPKGIDYVIALLSCWWSGRAFLPLDPSLPAQRLRSYEEVARPDARLTELPPREEQPPAPAGADSLAYVLCTSGSGAAPKAVEIEHRGLVPLLSQQIAAFGLAPGKRMLWLLSMQFDASLSDLGTALLSGATLVIPPACAGLDLPALLKREAITHLDIPPALLRVYSPQAFPDCLETLVVGGEPTPPARMRAWASRYRVINVYGPTEATICSSLSQVDPSAWDGPRLGRPIADMQYRRVGEELCLSGPGLARGYRHRPDLTEQAFFELEGRRYYRSGDRVRALDDGDWLFLGRLDRQVKYRGQRLELGEIETRLEAVDGVERAAALLVGGALLAYYAGASEVAPGPQLARELPAWMLPRLTRLEALPLTASGKIDYPALAQLAGPAAVMLDSLGALERAAELQAHGQAVSATELLGGSLGALTAEQMRSSLPARQPPAGAPPAQVWGENILVTGATGALGSRLVAGMLARGLRVFALARQPERLPVHPRLIPVPGDLLSLSTHHGLRSQVDTVLHLAAQVNMLLPLERLRGDNLDALESLLEFCQGKALHAASTLSLFVASDFRGLAREGVFPEHPLHGGYAQSKWAAEAYLRHWGGWVYHYRYGLLVGGAKDFLRTFLQGLAELGAYPAGAEALRVDFTPMDFAAAATLALAERFAAGGATCHIASRGGVSLGQLVECMRPRPRALAAEQFFALPPPSGRAGTAQLALCRAHPDPAYFQRHRGLDLFQASEVQFELASLERLGLDPPLPDLHSYTEVHP